MTTRVSTTRPFVFFSSLPMTLLEEYRSRPSPITPAEFSAFIPGASILYLYDPDPRGRRSYSERYFRSGQAAYLAQKHYSPFWSLNCFHNAERKERCFDSTLAVGADIDCATTQEFKTMSPQELDARKNAVLLKLQALGIAPHMVNETPKGIHIVFFIHRRTGPEGLRVYKTIMPLLVSYFGADTAAALVTQLLRFPNSLHQKNPEKPSVCTCLINQLTLPPYNPDALLALLQERCPASIARQIVSRPITQSSLPKARQIKLRRPIHLSGTCIRVPAKKWQVVMNGVEEGGRNDAAASVAGMLLHKFPQTEWQSHGWPALQNWNQCNRPPLDERELRAVFRSICRTVPSTQPKTPSPRIRIRLHPESRTK